jgi:hypothetical protein
MKLDVQLDTKAVASLARRFPVEAAEVLGVYAERVGAKLDREAKVHAPVVTGNLRRQIRFIKSSPIAGVVKAFANYSKYVHGPPYYENKMKRRETPFFTDALSSSESFIKREEAKVIPAILKKIL